VFSNQQEAQTTTFDIGIDVDNVVGTPAITQAGGSIDADGAVGTAFTDANGTNHSAGSAMGYLSGINDTPTNMWTLSFDSTGFLDLILRFDYRTTSTGSPSLALDYQVNGGGFTSISSPSLTLDSTYHALSVDLSAISTLENVASVDLRVTLTAGSSTGTTQFDNIQLTGIAVPEPSTVSLFGFGSLAMFLFRRLRA
jgi:hypothetical protein